MSKDYELTWPAHPNIYNNNSQRDLKFYFSEPEQGVNKNTGIVLFIPGFGGNAKSNVYKKMRTKFADKYNLITVQCDYFGQEFMQGSNRISINISKESVENIFSKNEIVEIFNNDFDYQSFINIASRYKINVLVKEVLEESVANFSDMGILQAIDNITALIYVMQILNDNQLEFDTNKIILFGQSQGAYISYLCNAFAPNLFSLLIDNSSWLFPQYINGPRYLYNQIGKMTLQTEFSYYVEQMDCDEELLYLPLLYKQVENQCKIVCFHGTTDNLISHLEKSEFCNGVRNCEYNEIGISEVDGEIFKSTSHGLEADFIKLFDYVFMNTKFGEFRDSNLPYVQFETSKALYSIDYHSGLPVMTISKNKKT